MDEPAVASLPVAVEEVDDWVGLLFVEGGGEIDGIVHLFSEDLAVDALVHEDSAFGVAVVDVGGGGASLFAAGEEHGGEAEHGDEPI